SIICQVCNKTGHSTRSCHQLFPPGINIKPKLITPHNTPRRIGYNLIQAHGQSIQLRHIMSLQIWVIYQFIRTPMGLMRLLLAIVHVCVLLILATLHTI
ncbi:hypothetical protein LINPERPRIM_LOCUS25335, partial [Linum perenne]